MKSFAEKNGKLLKTYFISSAKNGAGEIEGSFCTPRGMHQIYEKIGDDALINTVFVGRMPTGEVYSEALYKKHPERDWILTRILRLQGLEEGFNKGKNKQGVCCDSWQRYIYIHGAPNHIKLGKKGSCGCIRMKNEDILDLFAMVDEETQVEIIE